MSLLGQALGRGIADMRGQVVLAQIFQLLNMIRNRLLHSKGPCSNECEGAAGKSMCQITDLPLHLPTAPSHRPRPLPATSRSQIFSTDEFFPVSTHLRVADFTICPDLAPQILRPEASFLVSTRLHVDDFALCLRPRIQDLRTGAFFLVSIDLRVAGVTRFCLLCRPGLSPL